MKVWVYQSCNGIEFSQKPWVVTDRILLGTLDLDVKQEKKWVKKESDVTSWGAEVDNEKLVSATWVPLNARNVKITYEVEE